MGSRPAAKDDRAPDGADGERNQSRQLQRTPGGDVLDLPSRRSEPPLSRLPSTTIYGTPVFTPPDILPAANPATAGTPPADQILDKYIQALGGADRLAEAHQLYRQRDQPSCSERLEAIPSEIYAKAPDQLATLVHQREGDLARTFDGRDAWVMLPLTVVGEYPLTGVRGKAANWTREMAFPGGIKKFFSNWRVSYPTTLDGKDVYVVQGTVRRHCRNVLFRQADRPADADGPLCQLGGRPRSDANRLLRLSAGCRRHDAVQMDLWLGERARKYTLTEYQPNVAVDAAKFAKP